MAIGSSFDCTIASASAATAVEQKRMHANRARHVAVQSVRFLGDLGHIMAKPMQKGAEEARSRLPERMTAAQRDRQAIITRHERPLAVWSPISATVEGYAQRSLLPLAGSGRGLNGRDGRVSLRRLRDEWNR